MEDSTFQGWTTPPGTMDFPDGRKLAGSPHKPNYVGEVKSLPKATADTIRYAARQWPEGRASDFDRDGRTWVDRATGTEYRVVHGNPLLGDDPAMADLFCVEDDTLWFLRKADRQAGKSVRLGTVGGMRGTR